MTAYDGEAPSRRLYLLVRRDLPWSVRAVQAVHATVELARRQPPWGPAGPVVVLAGVEDEPALATWFARLGPAAAAFREPDLGGQLTVVACLDPAQDDVAQLRLL